MIKEIQKFHHKIEKYILHKIERLNIIIEKYNTTAKIIGEKKAKNSVLYLIYNDIQKEELLKIVKLKRLLKHIKKVNL